MPVQPGPARLDGAYIAAKNPPRIGPTRRDDEDDIEMVEISPGVDEDATGDRDSGSLPAAHSQSSVAFAGRRG